MILIIDQSRKNAETLADMFRLMNVLSRGTTPKDATGELSALYRGIIISSPEDIPNVEELISRIRKYSFGAPIFGICPAESPLCEAFDLCFKPTTYATRMKDTIIEYTKANDLPQPGLYALAGINISEDITTPVYFDTALPFTKTEAMIMRFLIRSYPTPVSAQRILKYAFRAAKQPEISNIRTHVSVINKKCRPILGRNLIRQCDGAGYQILTPELIYEENLK